jgi:hypothetical protein
MSSVITRHSTDFPIARGVSPPPRPFRRVLSVPPPAAVEARFAPRKDDRTIVRPPVRKSRRFAWVLESALVALLAGYCMAAGWWLMHGRGATDQPPLVRSETERVEAKTPITLTVEKPAQPVEKPAPRPSAPQVMKPEKPVAPPANPIEAPKPLEKATATLTFQKDILPILRSKCILCHGDRNKFKGGLDLRTLKSLEKGGDSGPAINRQELELSPLWDTVSSGQMPPGKSKLSDIDRKKLHDWLAGGAK